MAFRWLRTEQSAGRFTPGARAPVPTGQEAGWVPEPVWTKKNPSSCRESEPGLLVRSLVTIPTELRW